jgi:glycosyltransferase involved in cell wall biosynthesis
VSRPDFSIILPVYDQADHIASVVNEYEDTLGRIDRTHELLLIVNGPPGDTLAVCDSLAQRHASVRTLHSERKGWGHAVRIGLIESTGSLICYTNAARTTAQDLTLMILYALANPGVVIKANRRLRESWRRRLGSLLYNLECRALFDLSCWDVNGTPKIFPREFGHLLSLSRDDDIIDAEFAAICRRAHYPMLEVPIFSSKRHGGRSTTRLASAVKMYWGALGLWRRMRHQGKLQPISSER